ncbi:acyl-CoA thioester hydrolase [Rhodospira trueperi]|uniref:Acyl-CoA thioester hydrolase n=1 Tax=Rhodospira trueperi TaxID=69960 RepID=A0A1G7DZZ7_9PROT|nr:acyl-CoA thioester hydrolase [Rhodospira trueperi]
MHGRSPCLPTLPRAPEGPESGPAAASLPDARDRAAYRFWTRDIVRFQDLDRLGHVNNVSFAIYLESGRVHFLDTLTPGSVEGTGIGWVIARLTLDFISIAYYPADVDIGSRVLRIGRTSCVIGQGLFIGDQCFGTAENVCVWADTNAGQSRPLPDHVRAALKGYLVTSEPHVSGDPGPRRE